MEGESREILKIHPDRLHEFWPAVKFGAEKILELCPDEPWIPEDVYASLRAGWAELHVGGTGFLITQNLLEDYSRMPVLHVWLAYSTGGEFAAGMEYLRKIAGNRPIRFHSPRKGWARRAKALRTEYEL